MMKRSLFIKITAALVVVATVLTVAACGRSPAEKNGAVDLLKEINIDRVSVDAPTKDTAQTLTDTFLSLFKATIPAENKSTLVSPLSIILALGMTADGTAGNTKAQFEALFGMTTEELDTAMAYLTSRLTDTGSKNVKFNSANSLWLAQSGVKFKTSYLERVKAAYDPSVYSVDFTDPATVDAINGWVNENTDKMIEKIIEYDDVDAATVAALVNALVFDAEWAQKFEKVTSGTFTSYIGKEQSVEMMFSPKCKYIEGKNFTGFKKDYDGGKFSFVALLPDEKTDIFNFARLLDGKTVYELISSDTGETANVGMPKFTFDFDADLIPALTSLGLTDVFGGADFTELAECGVGDIYVDKAIHKTHIEVDENGTKAAAATYIGTRKNAVMYEHEVVLDRPFFYMIVDNETSLPVFIGVMTSIGEEMSDETAEKIKTDYIKSIQGNYKYEITPETVNFKIYGEFNGAYCMFIDAGFAYSDVITEDTVDGVRFIYSSSHQMMVYRDGEFYDLQTAFDRGFLTHDDLVALQKTYGTARSFLYEEY